MVMAGRVWKSKEFEKKRKQEWRGGQEVGLKEIMMYLLRTMGTAGQQQWCDL